MGEMVIILPLGGRSNPGSLRRTGSTPPPPPARSGSSSNSEYRESERACVYRQRQEGDQDTIAQEVANEIIALNTPAGNPDNLEYGAYVLRLPDGTYAATPLTPGTTGAVSLRSMMDRARTVHPDADASWVVGVVHSHPAESGPGFVNVTSIGQLSDLDYGNTMPSHPGISGTGPNDWENARSYLESNGGSSVERVSHYILGPDGVLRQYMYENGHPADSAEQTDRINQAEQDAVGSC